MDAENKVISYVTPLVFWMVNFRDLSLHLGELGSRPTPLSLASSVHHLSGTPRRQCAVVCFLQQLIAWPSLVLAGLT